MGWLQRLKDREATRPKTKIDLWIQRHREYVLRLPRWLVGTSVISSIALGVWCAIYDHGLMRVMSYVYRTEGYAAMATVAFTVLPCLLLLYGIARVVKPPPPTNLPSARVR